MVLEPCAIQPQVPIWVGGRTARSLRRAVRLADGWMPFGLSVSELSAMLAGVDVPPGFRGGAAHRSSRGPDGGSAGHRNSSGAAARRRATAVTCAVAADSSAHYAEQLAALRDIADRLADDTE